MKNNITQRYEKDKNNNLILKISTSKVEDLFDDYDKKSTFIQKDLKESLEKYLIQSVEEIGNNPFIIRFYFDESSNKESNEKVNTSIKEYFEYLQYWERKKMKEQIKNSFIFFLIGFVFVSISFLLAENEKFIYKLISEGAMVGGWVSLWEALATILIKWLPLKNKLKIFKKISNAKIEFHQS
ncbi:hypothetical protein [Arcobacter cloacae]|uniref:Uncharacterized protein n=1 Tax=Arcobacter cloacae TaxID=1054034 RepID=A0A4Q0ZJV7_9BACT|nr:hypothetical protein [Arcobacter cloacae]RXJ83846.1 hypothetical protein CRU90_08560 [Arcobacter cloacae]